MKRLLIFGSIALWLGYVTATAFLSVFAGPRTDSGLGVLLTAGSTVAVVNTSLVIAQLLANPADGATEAGRRFYRRLAWVFVGLLGASIVVTIIGAVLRQAPPWIPIAIAALTILCSVGPVAAAEHYRRGMPEAKAAPEDWRIGTDGRDRTFRRMAFTFVITTAITAAGLAVLSGMFDEPSTLETAVISVGLGAFSASAASLGAVWRLSTSTNLIFGTDIESRKSVGRVVARGKPDELSPEQLLMATQFAHVMREYLPIQLAQSVLTPVGLVLINLPALLLGDGPVWLAFVCALLGVMLVVSVVASQRQHRRVLQYSEEHPLEVPAQP